MSGPNILTATFKGIDAFSVIAKPYNALYVRLPPSEFPDIFFTHPAHKNNLLARPYEYVGKDAAIPGLEWLSHR